MNDLLLIYRDFSFGKQCFAGTWRVIGCWAKLYQSQFFKFFLVMYSKNVLIIKKRSFAFVQDVLFKNLLQLSMSIFDQNYFKLRLK